MSDNAVLPLGDSEHDWEEIDHFLAELTELAQSDISFAKFAEALLDRVMQLLQAAAGAVWVRTTPSELSVQCHSNLGVIDTHGRSPTAAGHTQFLQDVIHGGEACLVAPQSAAAAGQTAVNASSYFWIAAPFGLDGQVRGLVEVLQQPTINAATQRGNVKLLTMACELTEDFLQRQQLRELRRTEEQWQRYEQLVHRLHASLDLRYTAFQLVNEGRTFVDCDRVCLLVPRSGRLRVLAVSGLDTIDPRSHTVRSLESLAQLVTASGQALHYRGETAHLPPQIEGPLAAYVDSAHVQALDVIPLTSLPDTSAEISADTTVNEERQGVGVLILEQFNSASEGLHPERARRLCETGALALRNALDYDTLPLLSLARRLRRGQRLARRQGGRLALAAGGVLLLALALTFIPAPFYVRAPGELQPGMRRDIYAPLDAEIVQVLSQHDEQVQSGQVLLELHSRPLELELQRLQGEYQTTEKRLLAVAFARVQSNSDAARGESYPGQLAAEEQELKQLLESQQKQIALVREQRQQLKVTSPIAGRVLTWNPRELLENRPVQRGQLLMSTAAIAGPWIVELAVPESGIGYVASAQRGSEQPLAVTFSLASDRGTTYHGQVQQISARTEPRDGRAAAVQVTATAPASAADRLRPGATIYAKIHCGSRSLGFVWLHDIYETIKTRLLF
ncbi:MAG: efflux RND transporter periplasmic adaptor subunit [Planctomycetales bacterium]|nr:efflux RND transporter periplasmic adaptor subunit [Planctomycetales bacterium]